MHQLAMAAAVVSLLLILAGCLVVRCQLPGLFVHVPDFGVQTPQLILSRGFGYERHYVLVPDGFLIAIHRIIRPDLLTPGPPVIIQHGLISDSSCFLDTEYSGFLNNSQYTSASLAFEVAKQGYDVWLPDQRGTPFSSNNTRFTPRDPGYWDWSLDELALYDLPAVIDYVRGYRAKTTVGFIGHSQGFLTIMMLLSQVQRFNHVLKPLIGLGPVFTLTASVVTTAPEIRALNLESLEPLAKSIDGPFLNARLTGLLTDVCRFQVASSTLCDPIGYFLISALSELVLPNPTDINYDRIPVYLSAGLYFTLSWKQAAHYLQIIMSGRVGPRSFNQDPQANLAAYGSTEPPVYDVSLVSCRYLALLTAVGDVLAAPADVRILKDRLTVPLIYDQQAQDPIFGHNSVIFGTRKYLVPLIVQPVLRILQAFI